MTPVAVKVKDRGGVPGNEKGGDRRTAVGGLEALVLLLLLLLLVPESRSRKPCQWPGRFDELDSTPPRNHRNYVKPDRLKVVRIGNSRGVRLPAPMLSRYRIKHAVIAEEKSEGILLKPVRDDRLSWEDTYREIGAAARAEGDEFADMDGTVADGIDALER
jgi:antitoxin MazE